MNLVELFCHVDDFCQAFEAEWIRHRLTTGRRRRRRAGRLCLSELMTLLIWFHQSHYRDFKVFYRHQVCRPLRDAFPRVVTRRLNTPDIAVRSILWSISSGD